METFRDEAAKRAERGDLEPELPLKIRIAVADDEPQFTQQVARIAEEFFKDREEDFEVYQY